MSVAPPGVGWPSRWRCLVLGCIGLLFGSPKPAGADTPSSPSGQVFASVGNSAVNVYSQGSGNPLVTTLNDDTGEPYTAGSAFDSSGNFYVTDDNSGDVSEYAPDGTARRRLRQRAAEPALAGLRQPGQPLRRPADHALHRRVLQDAASSWQNIGPLATELSGDDWIDLAQRRVHLLLHDRRAPTSCATTSAPTRRSPTSTSALRLLRPLDGAAGEGLRAPDPARRRRPGGGLRTPDILLDPNGNVIQTYTCASLAGLPGLALRHEPRPRRHLVLDRRLDLGDIWQINIATGAVDADDRHPLGLPLRSLRRRPDRGGRAAAGHDGGRRRR